MIKGLIEPNLPRRHNYKYICTQHQNKKYIKQIFTELKGEIECNTIIVGDFNASLSSLMDRSSRQIINKETVDLKNAIVQIDLTKYKEHFIQKQQSICSS